MSDEPSGTVQPSRFKLRGEWVFCAILAAITCVFLVVSLTYPASVRLWPLAVSIFVIGLILIYTAYRLWSGTFFEDPEEDARAGQAQDFGEEGASAPEPPANINERATIAAGASFVLFAIFIYAVGFLLAGAVFVLAYMLVAGYRKPLTVIGVVIGASVSIYLLFGSVLNAPMTQGAFLQYDLSWLPV